MSNFVMVLVSIALTALSWGVYGPLMREGQAAMGGSHLLPFIFVGLAYFAIAVAVPVAILRLKGEKGSWTTTGIIWSGIAGAVTTIGALGIILALTNGGSPIYVMPLVFGCAPVVNTFLSMYFQKNYRQAGPLFYAGLILVIVGAVTVLVFNPVAKAAGKIEFEKFMVVLSFILVTALCWGSYGPLLHKGQVAMQGSRMRPFICVGLAYFLIAVLAPLALRAVVGDHGELTFRGALWSFAAGSAGAIGSLGLILAFNFGGKPVYVMPLVFGGAPVVNTIVSIATASGTISPSAEFFAGLSVVVAGAVTVLLFAPKPAPPVPGKVKAGH